MKTVGESARARRKRKPEKILPAKPFKRGLTPKQRLFVREYLVDMNATQAYLRAGYKVSEKVAGTNGPRMLENAGIKREINKTLHRRIKKLEISGDTVLQEIAKMAFCNMLDYITVQKDGTAFVDLSKLTREQAAAIQEISFEDGTEVGEGGARPVTKVKFKLSDKKGSLDMLGRYLKLFSDTTPVASTQTAKLLKAVLDGRMTAREAGYKFNMLGLPLPEVLKIELGKTSPEPPPPDLPPEISDEELEKGYQCKMSELDHQRDAWVPERQAEVKAIKDELKDSASFGPDADLNKGLSGKES